jgi:acetylornithine/succinyldiaminopimelate/putrescine aminotransferase
LFGTSDAVLTKRKAARLELTGGTLNICGAVSPPQGVDCADRPATFGRTGEGCISAIEALNMLYDEGLIDTAAEPGDYLIAELKRLPLKHPNWRFKLIQAEGEGQPLAQIP